MFTWKFTRMEVKRLISEEYDLLFWLMPYKYSRPVLYGQVTSTKLCEEPQDFICLGSLFWLIEPTQKLF